MRKKILMGALALALAGGAGAQCVQPTIPSLPRIANTGLGDFAPWLGSGLWSSNDITGTGTSGANGTDVQGLYTSTDGTSGKEPYEVYTPATREQVRFTKFLTVFSNNATTTAGMARTVQVVYGGVVYAHIETTPVDATAPNTGFIYALNGAQVFDENGRLASQTDANGFAPAGTLGVRFDSTGGVGLLAATIRDPDRLSDGTQFFLLLPESIPATGDFALRSTVRTDQESRALVDDVVVYKPESVPTTFCLEKAAVNGAPTGTYDFTTTERDGTPKAQQITGVSATPTRQTNAYQIFGDYVDVRELTAGTYGISSIRCQSDTYQNPNGKPTPYLVRPETAVNTIATIPGETGFTSPLGTRNFRVAIPSGTQTVCSIVNDGTPQGQVTTTKTFPKGRYPANDQATITQSSAGVSDVTYTTTGTGTNVNYTVTDPALRVIRPATTYTVPPATTTQDSITVSGQNTKYSRSVVTATRDNAYTVTASETVTTPGNYSASYSCTDASGTTRISGTGTSLSVGGVKFGDVITCTFVNNLTVTPPSTTVNVTKDGLKIVTAGTAVTYSITAQNTTATAVDVVLTDQLSPAVPAEQVTSVSDGGTYDAMTGLVTWPRVNLPANGSVTRTVTVDVPDPVQDAANGDSYSGPNQVTDTANLTAYTAGTDTSLANNGTSSASVTTNHLFAQVRKTVRNETRGGTAGTSADAEPGDVLEYCLNYTNQSAIALDSMTVRDTLTAGQTLLTGVYSGETLSLTRGDGAAQPTANSGSATTVSTTLTNVAAGETGQLCFQTQMDR